MRGARATTIAPEHPQESATGRWRAGTSGSGPTSRGRTGLDIVSIPLSGARRTLALAITLGLAASLAASNVVATEVQADAHQDRLRDVPRTRTLPGLENAPFPYAASEDVGLDSGQLTALADLAQGWVAEGRIVGAEMLIVKDRRIVLHEAVGWSDREAGVPMARNSVFRLRSMTKPFTGTAALRI